MNDFFTPRPTSIPANFTAPNQRYRLYAWLTALILAAFALAYLALALWFIHTAWQLFMTTPAGEDGIPALIGSLLALILGLFLIKGLLFFRRGKLEPAIEILPADQPQLFSFLYQLADEAGAPRPHRVFISPEVNACVFYDFSPLNLIFPSRKNLNIGFGLINNLNLGEFKAVCAHEFGHFAQRSMAVGTWVYMAEQIVSQIIYRRDRFDNFIDNGDGMALISLLAALPIWAMRALLEAAMSIVTLAERALSREMEFQADKLAVSLTGSDALLAALHRMRPAEEAWASSINFFNALLARNLAPPDFFSIQTRILEHLRTQLKAPDYGLTPRQAGHPDQRIFSLALARPPRMWSTHPLNHEREDQARQIYLPCTLAPDSAWVLFNQAENLRSTLTSKMYDVPDARILDDENCIAELTRYLACTPILAGLSAKGQSDEPSRQTAPLPLLYATFPHDRPLTQHTSDPTGLYAPLSITTSSATLDPAEFARKVEQLAALNAEVTELHEFIGMNKGRPASIPFRGKPLPASEWPDALVTTEAEIHAIQQRLQTHDQLCRRTHHTLASKYSGAWLAAWESRLALLHYAEHSAANLRDLQHHLHSLTARIAAASRITEHELDNALQTASQLYSALNLLYGQRDALQLPAEVLPHHDLKDWKTRLGKLDISMPSRENINDWANIIDNWVNQATHALDALRQIALHALLECEARLAQANAGQTLPTAPAQLLVPKDYPRLLTGNERRYQPPHQHFVVLRGIVSFMPGVLKFASALCIIAVLAWLKAELVRS